MVISILISKSIKYYRFRGKSIVFYRFIKPGLRESSVEYITHNNLIFVIDNKYAATKMLSDNIAPFYNSRSNILVGDKLRPATFSNITLYEGLLFSFENIVRSQALANIVDNCELNSIRSLYNLLKESHIQSLPQYTKDMATLCEGRYEYGKVMDEMYRNQVKFQPNLNNFLDLFKHSQILIPIDMDNYYPISEPEIRKIIKLFNHENLLILFYNCDKDIKEPVYNMS